MRVKFIDRLLADSSSDPGFVRTVIVMQVIALAALVAVIIVINTITALAYATWVLSMLFVLVAASLALALRGYLFPGRILVPFSLIVAITAIVFRGNGIHDTAVFGFPVSVLMSGMLLGRRGIWPYTLLCIGAIGLITHSEMIGLIASPYSTNTGWDDFLINSALLAACAAILQQLMGRMKESLQHARENEKALRDSERMYRRAIMTAGAVPYYLDHRTDTYTFMGDGILQMTGYTAAEMNPQLWKSLEQEGFPRGGLAHLTYEEADRLTEEDSSIPWECDYRIRTRDGQTRWVADTSVKGLNENEERVGVIGILQDITDRKLAVIEREKLIRDLEARNAELERFTYTVSHDLKSPLVTIQGFLGYLEEAALSGNLERMRQDSRRIRDATNKMQKLLAELLELSRIGHLINQPEEVPFDNIVQEALKIVEGQLQNRGVKVTVSGGLPKVHGDRARLVEVMQNLVDNACKYMGDQSEPRIEIGCATAVNGEATFYVRDNGIGIDPRFHERIFGLFNKLDSRTEGSGVGLALVKRIVEVHGGRLWVESEGDGCGSTFCFTLQPKP